MSVHLNFIIHRNCSKKLKSKYSLDVILCRYFFCRKKYNIFWVYKVKYKLNKSEILKLNVRKKFIFEISILSFIFRCETKSETKSGSATRLKRNQRQRYELNQWHFLGVWAVCRESPEFMILEVKFFFNRNPLYMIRPHIQHRKLFKKVFGQFFISPTAAWIFGENFTFFTPLIKYTIRPLKHNLPWINKI